MSKAFKSYTKSQLNELKKALSDYEFNQIKFRRTGKSLGIAYETIGVALQNPNKKIPIKDHYPTKAADRFLMETIFDIVKNNKLIGFTFDNSSLTITFNLNNGYEK